MKFIEAIQNRYTTKAYNADKRVDDSLVNELMECLRLSPSSINSQPWGFKLVSDPALKEQLAQHAYFNAEKVRGASHLIVLCVYKDAATFAQERLPYMDKRVQDYFQNNLAPQGEEVVMSWLSRQVYIALGVLLSGAALMQIDSTTMEGIDTKAYTEILGLGDKYRVLVAVALGVRDPEDSNQPSITPKDRRQDAIL